MKIAKRWLVVFTPVLLALTLASAPAMANSGHGPGTFGIGLGSGTMTRLGLSGKYFMGSTAIQGNLGCFGWGCDGVAAGLDFLWEMRPLADGKVLNLAWNAGLGPGVGLHSDTVAVAGAFVLGLEANFKAVPIDLVLEYRPTLLIVPDVHLDLVEFTGQVRVYLF